MPSGISSGVLFDGGALAAVTTFVISILKPFVEKLPFARPDSSTHDATLRILNVVINALTVIGLQLHQGTFTPNNWLAYLAMSVGQTIASLGFYHAVTNTSGAASALKVAPPVATPVRW